MTVTYYQVYMMKRDVPYVDTPDVLTLILRTLHIHI